MKRTKKSLPKIDHLAIAVENLDAWTELLHSLGFKKVWHRDRIGNRKSAMKTSVMQSGEVTLAIMEGIDGTVASQITECVRRRGDAALQHIAIEVANLKKTVGKLEKKGVKFLTPILMARDQYGTLLQAFTYPLISGIPLFLEFNERINHGNKKSVADIFADKNVKGLWNYVDRAIEEGWFFEVNIFGKKK